MPEATDLKFSIEGEPVYPHIKLTDEEFPRFIATRRPKDDGAEYFGAFLNRTSVRILIDLLNRTFKLRSCDISVDGSFTVPCTQYYEKRCVAPCVASLCGQEHYRDIVEGVRLFLRNDRDLLRAKAAKMIDAAAAGLDFENAAFWRDILHNAEEFWAQPRRQVWLDDTVDTYETERRGGDLYVFLVSQRRRKALGSRTWRFAISDDGGKGNPLGDVIRQFYAFHLPREIRVSEDFQGRLSLAKDLGRKFGRKIEIKVVKPDARRVTTSRAMKRSRYATDLADLEPIASPEEIRTRLKQLFRLEAEPLRIEAYDVAHISGTSFIAGTAVWKSGSLSVDDYSHWPSDRDSELSTLEAFVDFRIREGAELPDLVVIDGGTAQLNAAIKGLQNASGRKFRLIAAAKPRTSHSSISHFIDEDGKRYEFDSGDPAHRLLKLLRDEAHDLANSTHRHYRDMRHYYELAGILPSISERQRQELVSRAGSVRKITEMSDDEAYRLLDPAQAETVLKDLINFRAGASVHVEPLVVPISFVEQGGDADDLRPIKTR